MLGLASYALESFNTGSFTVYSGNISGTDSVIAFALTISGTLTSAVSVIDVSSSSVICLICGLVKVGFSFFNCLIIFFPTSLFCFTLQAITNP